jgi:phytanoyl-CoA hydroxylase
LAAGLTAEQIEFFHREGYLHVPDALGAEDLDPVQIELEGIVEAAAQRLLAAGTIDQGYGELSFDRRLIPLVRQDASAAEGINFPANLGTEIFDFLHNSRLLNIVECLVGTEIYAHSCQHIRAKLPATGDYAGSLSESEWARSTAWHQDLGVLLPEADETLIVTSWIPLVDAGELNGTLRVIPRCHTEPLRRHVRPPEGEGGSYTVAPEELPDTEPMTVTVERGGLILLHCRTPHGSEPNRSQGVRWSMDLRWNDARMPNGRPQVPGMLVRSQESPDAVVTEHADWVTAMKLAQVSRRGSQFYRWH